MTAAELSTILSEYFTTFVNEPWFGAIVGLVGVLLAVAFFLYHKFAPVGPRIACHFIHSRLIGGTDQILPQDLEMRYKGEKIERLTKTLVMLWNMGNRTVKRDDIVEGDWLRVELDRETRALDAQIVKKTRDVNNLSVVRQPSSSNQIIIDFDYLDPGDGVVIEILHTGTVGPGSMRGTIRGMPKGVLDLSGRLPTKFGLKIIQTFGMIVGLIFIFSVVKEYVTSELEISRIVVISFGLFLGIGMSLLGAFALVWYRRRFPRILAMKDFYQ